MPYTHYGEIGDIWKHLPLCEILAIEQPGVYIETNAAFPAYQLAATDSQQFGIGKLRAAAAQLPALRKTAYLQTAGHALAAGRYLGSPALAMELLGSTAEQYLFFDLEPEPLTQLAQYAKDRRLAAYTFCKDAVEGVTALMPTLGTHTFIHIDPYRINEKNEAGHCFLDVYLAAMQAGIKCMLWYGYTTLQEKSILNRLLKSAVGTPPAEKGVLGIEMIIESIEDSAVQINPGVLGCGILTANLSPQALDKVRTCSRLLEEVYRGALYQGKPAGLLRDEII